MSDLLLLQLLKVPVWLIKKTSKALAICTYVPNYFLLLLIDTILFRKISFLSEYCLWWIPRLFLLLIALIIFPLHFYALHALLGLHSFGFFAAFFCLAFAFIGTLVIMREGYLLLINRFHLTKLKSVKEHFFILFDFIFDVFTFVLAIVNLLLVVQSHLTFKYTFDPIKRNFFNHIKRLVRMSFLKLYLLFTIKTFFRLFPWRLTSILKYLWKEVNLSEKDSNSEIYQVIDNIDF